MDLHNTLPKSSFDRKNTFRYLQKVVLMAKSALMIDVKKRSRRTCRFTGSLQLLQKKVPCRTKTKDPQKKISPKKLFIPKKAPHQDLKIKPTTKKGKPALKTKTSKTQRKKQLEKPPVIICKKNIFFSFALSCRIVALPAGCHLHHRLPSASTGVGEGFFPLGKVRKKGWERGTVF